MTKLSEKLVGKAVTLICFGEYVGFIHIGDNDHCRIESGATIVDRDGNQRALFPEPSQGALASILGANVRSITIDKAFSASLDNGSIITAPLQEGYESIMLSVGGQSEVY